MNRFKNKIGLTLSFSISLFIINLITTIIVLILLYLLFLLGVLKGKNIKSIMILPGITLIACIIIGVIVSACSSKFILKKIREFVKATDKLSQGDFSARLNIKGLLELRALSENFNKMAEELGGIEVLRTDFINNFSHEFKTPIISIKGFAEILKDDDLKKEERDEYLDIIIEESKRLTSLANNVLNLSKIETQAILKDTQKYNVGEQIRQCILLMQSKIESKNIMLDINIKDYYLVGNKEMLSQVWLNLLDNSIKFNKESGIIGINVIKKEEEILISFSNNGPSISSDKINKIFDKFYQGDQSHKTKGNGLGLAIVKKIVELHRGAIVCESIDSNGTKFIITLPIEIEKNKSQ